MLYYLCHESDKGSKKTVIARDCYKPGGYATLTTTTIKVVEGGDVEMDTNFIICYLSLILLIIIVTKK